MMLAYHIPHGHSNLLSAFMFSRVLLYTTAACTLNAAKHLIVWQARHTTHVMLQA